MNKFLALIGLLGVTGGRLPAPRAGEDEGGPVAGGSAGGEVAEVESLSLADVVSRSSEGAVAGGDAEGVTSPAGAPAESDLAVAGIAEKLEALEAEKTSLAAELEAQRQTASALQQERDSERAVVAMRSDFEREKGAELDALDDAVLAGEMTEAEAEARGAAIAKAWKADRDSQSELSKLKSELETLRGEKAKTDALATVQRLIADSPEMKVGGDAAQKFILDAVLEGKDAAAAFAQVTAMIQSVAGVAVEAQKARDAAAAAAGPNIGGGAPAAGAGDEPEVLSFTQLAEKALAWRPS